MKYLMNTNTGSVDTYESWQEDSILDNWDFKDALIDGHLVEVEKDTDGDWVEVE